MTVANQMKTLFDRLEHSGLPTPFIRRYLPSWWDSEADTSPSALMELKLAIARRFDLDPRSILNDSAEIHFRHPAHCKFKRRSDTNEHELDLARAIATSASRIAVAACEPIELQFQSPSEIRNHILQTKPYVDIESLLEFAWSNGIPVLHISKFPGKKMQGIAVNIHGRHSIVLSYNQKHTALLLFHLAHELGHVILKHVDLDGILIDDKVDIDAGEKEEVEANRFAIELLTGSPDTHYRPTGRWLKAKALADAAKSKGIENKVDPGHIALSYAHYLGHWGVGIAALKLIEPNADAPKLINKYMSENTNKEMIPEDSYDYLIKITK